MHPGVCNLFETVSPGSRAGNQRNNNATVSGKMEENRRETAERSVCSGQEHS